MAVKLIDFVIVIPFVEPTFPNMFVMLFALEVTKHQAKRHNPRTLADTIKDAPVPPAIVRRPDTSLHPC